MKLALRSLAALGLLLSAYLTVIGLVAGLAFAVRAAVGAGGGYGAFRLLLFVVLLAAAMVGSLVVATVRRPQPVSGVRLTRGDQPEIWTLVDRVAAEVRTRAPDELVLVEQANAAVLEEARFPGRSHRVLVVGAPLLVTLRADQLTAVLAHEMGHYSGRHTALDRMAYRGNEILIRLVRQLGPRSLLGRVVALVAGAYGAIGAAVSRRYELDADAFAAELVGPQAVADAVTEVPLVAAGWHYYRRADVLRAEDSGRRPTRMVLAFGELWARGERRERAAVDANRWRPASSTFDTHPETEVRVARLLERENHVPGVMETLAAHSALSLMRRPEETFAHLEEQIYAGRDLVTVDWDELVAEHGRERARSAAAQLASAAEREGLAPRADLAALLELVEDGRATALTDQSVRGDDPELVRRLRLVDRLTLVVEDALVERHGYRHTWGPDGDPVLVGPHGEPLPVREMVRAAVSDPSAVEPLRRWAGERGLLRVHRASRR